MPNTYLYRHFSADGQLLYVGISLSALTRTVRHSKDALWFEKIQTIKIESFPTTEEAMHAEIIAIQTERPLYNKFHAINDERGVFTAKTRAFSIRVPPRLMEYVADEAEESGRSRDKQMIAILADRYGVTTTNKEGES